MGGGRLPERMAPVHALVAALPRPVAERLLSGVLDLVYRPSTPARTVTAHVYVARLLTDGAMAELHTLGVPLVVGEERPPTREELLRDVTGAAVLVCTLTERVDAAVLDAAGPQLRLVANVAVGYDNVDVPAARARGVVVTNTPGVLDDATADLTLGLILAAARRIPEGDRFLRRARRGSGGRG